MLKKILLVLISALFLLAGTCAAEETGDALQCEGIVGPYVWMDYELSVDSVRVAPCSELFGGVTLGSRTMKEDTRILVQIQDPMVQIRLLAGEDGIAYADLIQDNFTQFMLVDASGEEIPLYGFSWWGVGFDPEKGFGSADVQEGFLLNYFLPEGVNAEELVLTLRPSDAE